jgi:DNA-binding GntR family transcriptional regulator
MWDCSGNPFLSKALSQITVPLFAFWTLQRLRDSDVDLPRQASAHERIAQTMIAGSRKEARKVTRQALGEFWRDGARVARQC